jgi:hypothetical protein
MNRWIFSVVLVGLASLTQAASRSESLDGWLQGELLPYVRQQLTTLPRFKNESLRFVVMLDDSPKSEGSELAIRLRDTLRDAASALPGVRVVWQADLPGVGLVAGQSELDCTRHEADYLIGIELHELPAGEAEVTVRALDIAERAWVSGFSKRWQGPVTDRQRRQLNHIVDDPTFRGERNAPWNDSETDLMAAHLAYELGCSLLKQTAGQYVVAALNTNGSEDQTTTLVELVSNNLSGTSALKFSADSDNLNAVIEGKAHRIDGDLFQYWVTISPAESNGELATLSADAYVRIPDKYQAAMLVPEAALQMPSSAATVLTSFSVVRLQNQQQCLADHSIFAGGTNNRPGFGGVDCYALEVQTKDDAVVFFLNHQLSYGMVRLADNNCTNRTQARVARRNENLRYPLPLDSLQSGSWSVAPDWSVSPNADTYYVVASSDSKAARALSRHMERLPKRCSASVRPGLEGDDLRAWLSELEAIISHWSSVIDWRSIAVKDVF